MKNSISYLDIELNKIFETLTSCCSSKVSFILSRLNLGILANEVLKKYEDHYRFDFSFEQVMKLYLFKKLKRFTRYPKLFKYLHYNLRDAHNLGFYKDEYNNLILPSKRRFNDYLSKIDKEIKKILNLLVELIISKAQERNIILDITEIKKVKRIKTNREDKRKRLKEVTKLVKKLVFPQIKIKQHHNTIFNVNELLNVLVHVAYTHDFAHNGAETYSFDNGIEKHPSSHVMLHHFRKFDDINKLKLMFRNIFDIVFKFAKKNYNLLNRRKLDIAIDVHDIPYYGDKNDDYVMEGKQDRGTTHFFKFITCSIVVSGRRFVIDAIPMHSLDRLEELVNQLIKRAKQKINIDKVYLDRGFDKPKVVNILKDNNVKFVMPKIKSPTVKNWIDRSEGCEARIIKNFEIGKKDKAIVNLILVDDEEDTKRAFITNFHIPEQLTHYLYSWYSKRWGIETSYRNMDHDFKPRTTSKNYFIRLFYFLFTVCLYNLWILVNILVSLIMYGRLMDKPIITAKLFASALYRVAFEDPPT